MPRSFQPVELNTFVGGLITEASPLTFPQNASLDELNFVLNKDGSRSRRLGMDVENNFNSIFAGSYNYPGTSRLIINSFKWDNVGGDPQKTVIVVQTGLKVDFFDGGNPTLSGTLIHSDTFTYPNRLSFAAVDGRLIVTSGGKDIVIYTYDSITNTLSLERKRLLIRDLFGLEDIAPDGTDMRSGTGISYRPLNDGSGLLKHMYNLKNQTWAIPRPAFDNIETPVDVVSEFYVHAGSKYPSNADSIIPFIYADTNSKLNKTMIRFDPKNMVNNPPGTLAAPRGYFIIDALDRGTSRQAEIIKLQSKYPQSDPNSTSRVADAIPTDTTPNGPSCVCEYAGRIWYAGFPGDIIGGDSYSPKMSSYVLFSQLVKDSTDITSCYQEADPTDKNNSDLVDTDGGFLRIQGAYNISGMVNLGTNLLVFAQNGVWSISGGNSYGFTATNYKVSKLTSAGCISPGSIVVVENSIFYWGRDGIYNISQNQYGDYSATNITIKTIQRFYNAIPELIAKYSEGVYDSFEKQVKWLYYNGLGLDQPPIELILDLNLNAFYKHQIKPVDTDAFGTIKTGYPLVLKGIQTNPYSYDYTEQEVVSGPFSDNVVVGVNDVIVNIRQVVSGTKEVMYLILLGPYGEALQSYTFGSYSNTFHYDWTTFLGEYIDAESHLITGYLSGGDYQRNKQIVYLTVHCARTEVGSSTEITDRSSCLTQVQWDWTNDASSNRWTRQFQSYRLFGPYYPDPDNDTDLSSKFNVIETRNKVRGQGKVISIKFNSEPGNHLTIYGWSINMGTNGNV